MTVHAGEGGAGGQHRRGGSRRISLESHWAHGHSGPGGSFGEESGFQGFGGSGGAPRGGMRCGVTHSSRISAPPFPRTPTRGRIPRGAPRGPPCGAGRSRHLRAGPCFFTLFFTLKPPSCCVLTAITRAVLALSTGGVWIHALMRVDGRRRSGCVGPARFEQWVAVRDDGPAASRFAPRPG